MSIKAIETGTNQLLCEVRDRVAIITLNRPEVRNALGNTITPALRQMIRDRGEDPEVGALLLTADTDDIDARVRSVRGDILLLSGLSFLVTALLSIYLAWSIFQMSDFVRILTIIGIKSAPK